MDYQKDDIQIILQNPGFKNITMGIFDNLEDKRPIKVGSIIIGCTVQSFFHSNILILDKTYLLHHYVDPKAFNVAIIYNFKPGVYLSELENVILHPETDQNKFLLLACSTVWVTISVAK